MAVLEKKDNGGINVPEVAEGFVQAEPGPVGVYSVSGTVLEFDPTNSAVRLANKPASESIADFYAGLVGCSHQWSKKPYYGDLYGRVAYVLGHDDTLDHILVGRIAGETHKAKRTYIIYERSEIDDNESVPPSIQILRAPYELIGESIR